MKGRWAKYLLAGTVVTMFAACSSEPTDRGQQYRGGKFIQPFSLVNQPDAIGALINVGDFTGQVNRIHSVSPRLYDNQSDVYNATQQWLHTGDDTYSMRQFGIDAQQMKGADSYDNTQSTDYYTPVIQAHHTRQGEFQYPIYRMSPKRGRLPSRAGIYAGAPSDNYILAYSNSLMDNFIMGVQGSGYIDFGDGSLLNSSSYTGRNSHAYRSIGRMLINRSEVEKENMSVQAIRHRGETHSEAEVRELLEQNPSFIFFKPQPFAPMKGASAVPLIGRASVVSDRSTIPAGTTLLAKAPLLDNNGKFTGQYELRLMVASDVGGAIRGQHFNIYQGIGAGAGHRVGWYNHYGRVWVLKTAPGASNVFSGQLPDDTLLIKSTLLSRPDKAQPTSDSQTARY